MTGVAVTSDAGDDDTYILGDVIRITLTFSEAVEVTGAPRLKIDMDPAEWGEKWAGYEGGSGTAPPDLHPHRRRTQLLDPGHRGAGGHAGTERRKHQVGGRPIPTPSCPTTVWTTTRTTR